MNITADQMVKVMEAMSPELVAAIRAQAAAAEASKLKVSFTAEERRYVPEELIKLAEAACPEWSRQDFSIRRWMDAAIPATRKLREAHSDAALAFLLRKGVLTIANDWYNVVPREWQEYCMVSQSNARAEFYAPLYASSIAGLVGDGDRFPEGKIVGENSVVVNYKFGLVESFDRTLFDDDQTGQIRLRASRLGQSMALTENVYAAFRFIGVAQTYLNLPVPASKYTTVNVAGATVTGPWSKSLYGTAGQPSGGNRLQAFAALSLNGLKQLYTIQLNVKDPNGQKIITSPNILLVSPTDALHAPLLVNPPANVPYYPAVIGAAGSTASTATAGYPGGVIGANPFMGLGIKVVVARFLPNWAWAFGEKKGLIWQERDALEVIQENPASGAAFEVDAYRFRSRRRFEAEWIGGGSRFWALGNPGVDDAGTGIVVDGDTGVAGSF